MTSDIDDAGKSVLLGLCKRFMEWWHPMFTIETRDVDELGYGTVILRPAKRTLPARIKWWSIGKRHGKKPITMHVGTEDMKGFFHEFDSWTIGESREL